MAMKYHFVDRLQDFEFHDGQWKLIFVHLEYCRVG